MGVGIKPAPILCNIGCLSFYMLVWRYNVRHAAFAARFARLLCAVRENSLPLRQFALRRKLTQTSLRKPRNRLPFILEERTVSSNVYR